MKWEIVIVGRGGQGILLLGRVLGLAASKYAGLYSVATETYAAETRGGESRSDVVIAKDMLEIDYVKVTQPDVIVMLFPFNVEAYKSMAKPTTAIFLDSGFVDPSHFPNHRVYAYRYTELAEKSFGTPRVANMVVLGHIVKVTGLLSLEHVKGALSELVPEKWLDINIKALELGYSLPA